ncbi:MAG: alpha/beta hydrolase [Candidatus Limnocylindria bacterium]|nr:alpha/beta hydrolase [Candidatus Limnocylindria bacterium]
MTGSRRSIEGTLDPDTELAGLRRIAARVGAAESATVPPIRRTITGGDVPLNLVDWGAPRPDARTVLFVHGAQLTARTWDGVCVLLRDTYRCVALDLRGHGDSGWSGERRYGLEDHLGDLTRVTLSLGARELALVGMSMGGFVATAWAETLPPTLTGLGLVDIGPHAPGFVRRPGSRSASLAERTASARTFEDFVAHAHAWSPKRDVENLRNSLRHALRLQPDGSHVWKWDPAQFTGGPPFLRDEVWARAGTIACRTLLVRGARSDVLSVEGAAQLVASLRSGTLVTIEGAGHTVQSDKPRELAAALREFLGSR